MEKFLEGLKEACESIIEIPSNFLQKLEKPENVRVFTYYVLFIISTYFSITLFLRFGSTWLEKALWGSVACAFEFIRFYVLSQAKTDWSMRKKSKEKTFKAIVKTGLYSGFAAVSVLASIGWLLTSSNLQSKEINVVDYKSSLIQKDISDINNEIGNLIILQAGMGTNRTARALVYSEKLSELRSNKTVLMAQMDSVKSEVSKDEVSSDNIFSQLGAFIHISGKTFFIILISFLMFLIEVYLFYATKEQKVTSPLAKEDTKRFLQYVDNLKDDTKKRLNTDATISGLTGISLSECKKYREILREDIRYKGVPAISMAKGTSSMNFTPDSVKHLVENYLNMR